MSKSNKFTLIDIDMEWASKLVEVISKGVGSLTALFIEKQIINNKKYEIKEIAQAIADTKNLPVHVNYDNGEVSIKPKDDSINPSEHPEYRAVEYMIRRETQRMSSLEKASLYAAEHLNKSYENGESISEKKLDDKWIAKYFDEVGNIREEKALEYWGKLLAGEIKQPGSYSIRTLNLLANLSNEESELISHALDYVVLAVYHKTKDFNPRDNFGFIYTNYKSETANKFALTHYKLEILASLGIIGSSNSMLPLIKKGSHSKTVYCGNYGLKFDRYKKDEIKNDIMISNIKLLTNIGLELLNLHKYNDNEEYVMSFANYAHKHKLNLAVFNNLYIKNDSVRGKVIKKFVYDSNS